MINNQIGLRKLMIEIWLLFDDWCLVIGYSVLYISQFLKSDNL